MAAARYDVDTIDLVRSLLATHDLVIAGYGGFDAGLAKIIAEAVEPSRTRIYWCGPSPPHRDAPLNQLLGDRAQHIAITFDALVMAIARPVRAATDTIEFMHPAGWTAVARGVIWRNASLRHSSLGFETVDTFTAHKIHIDMNNSRTVEHVIEWVSNIDDGPAWPERVTTTVREDFELRVGERDAMLRMTVANKAVAESRRAWRGIPKTDRSHPTRQAASHHGAPASRSMQRPLRGLPQPGLSHPSPSRRRSGALNR